MRCARIRWLGFLLALFVLPGRPLSILAADPVTNGIASFQTLGSSFSPALYFSGLPLNVYQWIWSDGTFDTSVTPTKDFGSPGVRVQTLALEPLSVLTAINLGFDGSDGGWTNQFVNQDDQQVNSVVFVSPLPNLQLWASSYNPITNTLNFSGFSSLQDIECFHCSNLQHVVVSSLPSLRRLCFEDCMLRELDISHNPNLEDMRAALNSLTGVKIGGGTGPKIWHWCFRDNPQITQHFQSIMTNFFSLQEFWVWNANQSGALTFVSTNLTDVEIHHNAYTSADFSGQTNLVILQANDNRLTSLILTGCRSLETLQAQNNRLTTAAIDQILATLDNPAFAIQNINLAGNPNVASAAGLHHYTNLTERGVYVNLDLAISNSRKVTVKVQSSPPGRSLSVDGQNFVGGRTFRWDPGSEHVIATETPQTDAAGRHFDWQSWSDGGELSHSVVADSNATYTAVFTNPFTPFVGSYNGLFSDTNSAHHGSISILLTDRRTFTGNLSLSGRRYSLSGQFDLSGNATVNLLAAASSLTVSLALDMSLNADLISGTISDGIWVAPIQAVHAGFDAKSHPATNYSGAYTIVLPAAAAGGGLPEGNGYGTMLVDASGKVTIMGALGDATPYTCSIRMSGDGEFPIYLALYGGKGSLLGWLAFTNEAISDLNGDLAWMKPAMASPKLYSGGFTNLDQPCLGSRYQLPTPPNRVLQITNGLAIFSGGNLDASITNSVILGADDKVANQSTNKLTMSISIANGSFSGAVAPPGSSKAIPFRGVLLQKQNAAFGNLAGANQTSSVVLRPAP